MEPAFFHNDVTDDELAADLTALKEGRYEKWQLADEVGYETAYRAADSVVVSSCKRIWLRHRAGHLQVVTLQRPRGQALWRRL